jgi:TPR repeat protein
MSLPPAQSSSSNADHEVCHRSSTLRRLPVGRRKHPRHAFIAWLQAHPALSLACPDSEFVAELTAHPLYCLASRISVQRWEVMFRCRAPSQAHAQQWHVYGIDVGLKQRSTLLARAALCELLVLRLMRFGGACRVRYPQHHATCVVSRRHFLVSKNLALSLFDEGRRLYGSQRFSDAAKSWGQAALLHHAHSHALLSEMLIEGRQDVPKDGKRAFELAEAGASMGCAHSKGALGRCYMLNFVAVKDHFDHVKGYTFAKKSAAAGSCIGQFVVGLAFKVGQGVAQDSAEAVRRWRLAAEQGHADAQLNLAYMLSKGEGVAQDKAEAVLWYHLAAAQGLAGAQINLGHAFYKGHGVAQDSAEAVRWWRVAAEQGLAHAQHNLGIMYKRGQGVAQDSAEAVRWFRLAAAQGLADSQNILGDMLEKGEGVAPDKLLMLEAVRLYRLAAAQGCHAAIGALQRLGV